MMKKNQCCAVGVFLLLIFIRGAMAQTPLSPRNANYTIEVKLDPQTKMLTSREISTWRNDRDQPAGELWFHLYYNAWKNTRSTWLLERTLAGPMIRGSQRNLREDDWSYVKVNALKILPQGKFVAADLTANQKFAASDDGNPDDQTVMVVPLPQAVAPGESIQVELSFTSKISRTFARTGFRGNYFFIAQWFPKLGVYENGGKWNCHQFHAGTEFFFRLRRV